MGTLVNKGVEVAVASVCWRLREHSSLGFSEVLHPVKSEHLGMYATILLILYEFLSLEGVLDGLGDCGGVWKAELVSLL